MKNKKALIGYDWKGTTFQPEGEVQKGLITVNVFCVTSSDKMGTRDILGNSDGT